MKKYNTGYWKGKKFSEETKRKISESNKGKHTYWKGKHLSEETKNKIRLCMVGRKRPKELMDRIHKKLKGQKRSEEIRQRISLATKIAMQTPEIQEKIKKGQFKKKYYLNEQEIIKLYDKLPVPKISKIYNCSDSVILKILYKNNIQIKGISYFLKGKHCSPKTEFKSLDKHVDWLGGKSFEPYGLDFNDKFKEAIRERDNRCCIICNRTEEELNELLSIHHIDYDKKNSFPQNCASLCRSHHTDTNFNRQHWKTFFQSLLKERYNYEYTEDQKIILDFMEVK